MFWNFFRFELRFWLTGFLVYVFLLITAILVFSASTSEHVQVGTAVDNAFRNGPHTIQNLYAVFGILTSLMVAAFVNAAASRDFAYNTDQLIFSKPISKWSLLAGRFCGSTLIAALPMIGISLGVLVAAWMPWVDESRFGPISWPAHFWGFVVFAIPNTIFIAAIVFAISVWTRSTIASFIGVILLLVGYGISQAMLGKLENEQLAMLLDPFGLRAFIIQTKYWTVAERNTNYVDLSGMLLWNRLLWVSLGAALWTVASLRFSFSQRQGSRRRAATSDELPELHAELPQVRLGQGFAARRAQLASQFRVDFWGVVKGAVFVVVMVAGMLNMISGLIISSSEGFGLSSLPVTYHMIDVIRGSMYAFLLAVITFYAGVLVWRERESKLDEVLDALPHPTWISFAAKFAALLAIVVIIQVLAIVAGVAVQASSGYSRFQFGVYGQELLLIDLVQFACLIVMALLCHVLSPNKYVGYFAFIILVVANTFSWSIWDVETNMVKFGKLPNYIYSDLFGVAPYASGLFWFALYWILAATLLCFFSILLWQRGRETGLLRRVRGMGGRWEGSVRWLSLAVLIAWVSVGGWLYYNTYRLNHFWTPEQRIDRQVAYETRFKQFEHAAQPRVTDVTYWIDIFPETRGIHLRGEQSIVNRSAEPIDTIYITTIDEYQTELEIERATRTSDGDDSLNFRVYRVQPPMAPGERLKMEYTVSYNAQGFQNELTQAEIVQNGTFFNNGIVPRIGYQTENELKDKNTRRRKKLSEPTPMPKLDPKDLAARANSYLSNSSDWVNIETFISTSSDQIAIAPGSLLRKWTEGDRRHFHYRVDHPSPNFYSFISAKYQVASRMWNDVDVEVYYHPDHEWNVDNMLRSIRQSLEYCSTNFGPYRHKQARIIEFPRVAEFAQAFPGTMPYSEGIGFIADIKGSDDIDMVFYVVAHEMAHQWWGHQVLGANMQGATSLSETLAQYSALMIMEKEYGRDIMRKFLKYEMDNYLRSRGRERLHELPLETVEASQGYVHYRKGSVVMYHLKEMIGEENVNAALRSLVDRFAYRDPPYPTSLDLVDALKAHTPPELQYLLHDLFEQITLFGNRTLTASYRPAADGKFEVSLEVECRKFSADEQGLESEIPLDDWIEIGAFAPAAAGRKYGDTLHRERVRMQQGINRFSFVVNQVPDLAGVDPFYLLIDRMPEDNLKKPLRMEE